MSVPDFESLMKPVLVSAKDSERKISEVVEELALTLGLTEDERNQTLPSGKQTRFANRVHWARSYLKQAGLVKSIKRGVFEVTQAGRAVLEENPVRIDKAYLERFEEYRDFKSRSGTNVENAELGIVVEAERGSTPDEVLNSAYEEINATLRQELLSKLRDSDPAFFEDIIVRLLLKMGYGYDAKSGQVIGQSGDDGVDGVINLDRLGVDQVYVQAKRYALGNVIGSGAIRDFYGALGMKDVTKGIFVTTSAFSTDAVRTIEKLGARIVPIDGNQLAQLMIDHEVGCRVKQVYPISEVDDSFFE
ncbi:restriction endonuclease [Sulfitobacter sp. F26204]|uniref:winged helix-turn-helix domain-containing protein n=1 Tax=Sulfitobacter sp. F26204 TaxID=2996014 RepID=UPI00225E0847|nr:winged helix-turn-helix domain-containing protein [Sulfitobacter sp. F26204]MCX7559124.1 restriction endonuclease [Sulfitobacter sp. F26204]